jgi:hypothetical protein
MFQHEHALRSDTEGVMGPLGHINWRRVHTGFCLLMWVVAVVLAGLLVTHLVPSSAAAAHHVIRPPR